MDILVSFKKPELIQLCKHFHVQRLEIYGSAKRGEFNPITSDIDFLVEFDEIGVSHYADNYFGLLEALESLFSCPVEISVISSIKNPYFLKSIEPDREILYAA